MYVFIYTFMADLLLCLADVTHMELKCIAEKMTLRDDVK